MDMECIYQALYDEMKSLMKDDVSMKFYNETKPLYLKMDASGIGLGVALLQTRDGMTCPRDTAPDKHHSEANCISKQMSDQYGKKIQ